MLLVAEAHINEFAEDGSCMMMDAGGVCEIHLPELVVRARVDSLFMNKFAETVQAIQRSAWAYGWIARDKKEVNDEP
jgi:hypothetical protein